MTTTSPAKSQKIRQGVCIADGSLSMFEAHRLVRTTQAYQTIRSQYPLDQFHVSWVGSEVVCGCWHVTFEAEPKFSP